MIDLLWIMFTVVFVAYIVKYYFSQLKMFFDMFQNGEDK